MDRHFKILIIDDDEVDRMMVSRALSKGIGSVDLVETGSGAEGLAAADQGFDCIFLDYQLPDGDGLSVLTRLRAAGIDSPVVVLTGRGDERLAVEIMKAGASDYQPKSSVTGEGLARTVQHATRIYEAEQERKRAEQEQKILIEKLQEAQHQLLQSEKLASIGQLAAGVAHEINNPVGYINANLGALQQYVTDLFRLIEAYEQCELKLAGHEALNDIRALKKEVDLEFLKTDLRDLVSESLEGVNRVKQIVQDLKDFSHVDKGEWQYADIHRALDSTLNVAHSELKYKVEVVKAYGELPEVECNVPQINQVFMNLLVNAAQAINERGTITITTGTDGPDWVWVDIADTGKGIAPEHLNRIFEPFFTTKPLGQGTGLGLSVSYGIVERHGGHIHVWSQPGEGTRFRVRLPVKRLEPSPAG